MNTKIICLVAASFLLVVLLGGCASAPLPPISVAPAAAAPAAPPSQEEADEPAALEDPPALLETPTVADGGETEGDGTRVGPCVCRGTECTIGGGPGGTVLIPCALSECVRMTTDLTPTPVANAQTAPPPSPPPTAPLPAPAPAAPAPLPILPEGAWGSTNLLVTLHALHQPVWVEVRGVGTSRQIPAYEVDGRRVLELWLSVPPGHRVVVLHCIGSRMATASRTEVPYSGHSLVTFTLACER